MMDKVRGKKSLRTDKQRHWGIKVFLFGKIYLWHLIQSDFLSFQGYEPLFIHKIKHKHFLAKNYFSQIPLLASFLLDDGEVEEIRKKHQSEPTTKILEVHRPGP